MILLDELGVRYLFSLFIKYYIVALLYALLFYSYLTLTFDYSYPILSPLRCNCVLCSHKWQGQEKYMITQKVFLSVFDFFHIQMMINCHKKWKSQISGSVHESSTT